MRDYIYPMHIYRKQIIPLSSCTYCNIYIYIVRQKDKLELLHLNFNHYRSVSYGKRSLPHSSPDECGKLRLPYETDL